MQLDKLTIKSQEALSEAQSQAGGRGHGAIEPAHLLGALLAQPEGATVPVLQKLGTSLDTLQQQALASLSQHVREALDQAATELQAAQQQLLDSELQDQGAVGQLPRIRQHLQDGLEHAENGLNRLSASLELPRLLMLSDQEEIRRGAIDRARACLLYTSPSPRDRG